MQVDTWVVYKKMNFTDRIDEPTFLIMDLVDSVLLSGYLDPVTGNPEKVDVN